MEAGWSKGEARATGSHGLFSRWTCSRSIPLTERLPGKPEPLYRRAELRMTLRIPGLSPLSVRRFYSLSLSPPSFSPFSTWHSWTRHFGEIPHSHIYSCLTIFFKYRFHQILYNFITDDTPSNGWILFYLKLESKYIFGVSEILFSKSFASVE